MMMLVTLWLWLCYDTSPLPLRATYESMVAMLGEEDTAAEAKAYYLTKCFFASFSCDVAFDKDLPEMLGRFSLPFSMEDISP